MTTFAWPTSNAFRVENVSVYLRPNTREFVSQYTGGFQGFDLLGERWVMTGRLPIASSDDGALREAYFNRLRGVHFVSAHHFRRPVPRGTQRGVPVLSNNVAQGASALPISGGTPGATFEAGDMLGVGGELFQVAEAVAFNGSGLATIQTVNRVRPLAGLAAGTAVVWDRPTAVWRLTSPVAVLHQPGAWCEALDLQFVQV